MSHPQSRRSFLRVGSAGLLGLNLANILRSESQRESPNKTTSVILVWLGGGPATIDMWDPKPNAPEEIRGEFQSIKTSATGVMVSEHLARTAKVMDRCSLVRSLHHSIPAHGPGTQYLMTGNRPNPALTYPSIGALSSSLLPSSSGVPAYITFHRNAYAGAGYLGAAHNPFEVTTTNGKFDFRGVSLPDGFTAAELKHRVALQRKFERRFRQLDETEIAASLDEFQRSAFDILLGDKIRKAFDLNQESTATREAFGTQALGRNALAARRLVEAGARFVTIGMNGWDTHADNFTALRNRLLPPVDQALSALISDLDSRGLLDNTIVYCAGEFGRTPQINRAAGRDHWARSMSVLISGGKFRRGYVHGKTDKEGMAPVEQDCSPDDITATIMQSLGIAPDREVQTMTGRPVVIMRQGEVIRELLG